MYDNAEEVRERENPNLVKIKNPADVALAVSDNIQDDVSAAAKVAEDYRSKVFEFVKANMADTLQYAQRLANVKSPSEFIELSTRHARKQFETMTAQTAELTSLTQKLTACSPEQLTGGFSDASTVPHQGS